ncbi:MAG TPA: DUF5723 family protein [Bacteroidales bacterium]|nr:DUF5723 family protein [Bacteroidales bacterium]
MERLWKWFFILVWVGGSYLPAAGQEMLGMTLGNYAGVNSLQLNPSAMYHSKVYLDVNLLGLDVFFQNNYLYIDNAEYRFAHFFQSSYQYPMHSELYGTGDRMFYHYSGKDFRQAYVNLRINGPGAMLAWGEHTFAITTSVRSATTGYYLPYEVANFAYLGLNYVPQQSINYHDRRFFSSASLTWMEIGLSYAYPVYARGLNVLALGVSVKRLEGIAGGYVYSRDVDYIVPDDSTLIVKNANIRAGYSLPVNYDNNEVQTSPLFRGGGFSGDVGVTYYRLKNYYHRQTVTTLCSYEMPDYLYRIGLSLIDVGAIRFNKNAERYSIDNQSSYWNNINHFKYVSMHQLMDTISYKFYGDYTTAYQGNSVWVWLPSAVSVQFDYHLQKEWYLNACVIYGFGLAPNSVVRPSEISITPRYETDWFEADLPLSLYDWYLPRIGLSFRFYYLTIGFDKIGWFFHLNDFTGLDVYLGLKFSLDKGICGSKKQKGCTDMERYHTKHSYR